MGALFDGLRGRRVEIGSTEYPWAVSQGMAAGYFPGLRRDA
jgi:hypothetical protein